MDFDFTTHEQAFRQELRDWLKENIPRHLPDGPQRDDPEKRWERGVRWHQALYQAGYVGLHWPKEYGGRGASLIEQYIFEEEINRVQVPGSINPVGILVTGPTIMHWGSDEQKNQHLKPILSGDEIWCQGYSEPGAGSDVAALATTADDHGDYFLVNGQKVWTTLAHRSQYCMLLCRTDRSAPKHKGLSYLLVDMRTPGITVRPLVQMTGNHEFNEIFFEDVTVPKRNLLGPQNQGWQVGMTTLMFERVSIGSLLQIEREMNSLLDLVRKTRKHGQPAGDDRYVRQKVAQFQIESQAIRYSSLRQLTRRLRGQPPGPEGSTIKLFRSELALRMTGFANELLDAHSQLERGSPFAVEHGRWLFGYFTARSNTIAGGTSEVQRNIIGERVLKLPK